MRAFVALEVSERFRCEVAALARQLDGQVRGRFTAPENYHVTLAFLGDVDESGVRLAVDALEAACAGFDEVPLECDGLGKFGKARDATLWLGLKRNEPLERLAASVREELASRDIAFDEKPFKAHITIARRAALPAGELPALPFPAPDTAVAVTLFKSELTPDGARYSPLHVVGLQ